jgi:farnesyl-diphosphate farnesyltransferase
MTLISINHAIDCLIYLSILRDQSVFNFCAIPQVMAIATLALVYRNPLVFQRNIKIRRGEACTVLYSISILIIVAFTKFKSQRSMRHIH